MSALLKKAARDLAGEHGRSAGIVIALAAGIAGFLSVLSAYAIVQRGINVGYEASIPPNAFLSVTEADSVALAAASSAPGVRIAEARRALLSRAKAGDGTWRNLSLFVRSDPGASLVGKLELEDGDWPSGPGEIALERDALKLAKVVVGGTMVIRTEKGGERPFRVAGSVHDVSVAQARMERMVYAYADPSVLGALEAEPRLDEIAIRVSDGAYDEARVQDIAAGASAAVVSAGRVVSATRVPEPGHPHAKLMDALLLSNAIFGALILALAGIIVFNVLTALISGQRRQIGVMKALGGSRARIAGIYLLEAGILGAAGVLAALPIGLAGGRAISAWIAGLVNFNLLDWTAPPWVFGTAFAVGIGVPVAAALIPVWLGTRESARDAIASAGAGSRSFGTSLIDRVLARIPGGNRGIMMAVRNLNRNRLRTALTVSLLVLAGVFCMSALDVRSSLMRTVDRLMAQDAADAAISLSSPYPASAAEAAALQSPEIAYAEGWFEAEGFMSEEGNRSLKRDSVRVSGVPRGSKAFVPDLSLGTGLDGALNGIVINTTFYGRLGRPALGSPLELSIGGQKRAFRILGIQYDAFGVSTAWVERGFFDALEGIPRSNSLRIGFSPGQDPAAALSAADSGLKAAGMRSVSEATKKDKRAVMDEHMLMIFSFLLAVSGVLGGVGLLGIYTTVGIGVSERRRELGVMRAIGATPGRTALIVMEEALCAGLLSWAIASAAALPLGKAIGETMVRLILNIRNDIGMALDPLGVVAWLFLTLAGCAAASLRPALKAARFPVRDALSYE